MPRVARSDRLPRTRNIFNDNRKKKKKRFFPVDDKNIIYSSWIILLPWIKLLLSRPILSDLWRTSSPGFGRPPCGPTIRINFGKITGDTVTQCGYEKCHSITRPPDLCTRGGIPHLRILVSAILMLENKIVT